jgi:hypothetical protein
MIDSLQSPSGSISESNTGTSVEDVICTPEETTNRLTTCTNCVDLTQANEVTICRLSSCNISLMTTFRFKQCPRGNW